MKSKTPIIPVVAQETDSTKTEEAPKKELSLVEKILAKNKHKKVDTPKVE